MLNFSTNLLRLDRRRLIDVRYRTALAYFAVSSMLAAAIYPCSIVTLAIWRPVVAQEISGTVIGWDWEPFKIPEGGALLPPKIIALDGATFVLSVRRDTKFFSESDIKPEMQDWYRGDPRKLIGSITEYKCGE